ncbi:interleukin-32 isoform X1 [Myotis daubentonii]|uniref:interleukin-32 isoform X1 n=1 Tax=Myotis daubentonii TaxID=98922 RepID=UPI00287396C2|nr:interleukin-32 isoform X1 [Myotis daubentonii]
MGFPKTSKDDIEKMRSKMLKAVDTFCDRLKFKEENQVHICLKELEISINEASLDTVFAHCENNNQTFQENIEKMRSEMHKDVDTFCDLVKSEEEDKVNIGLEELENNFNEAALDAISAHCENNDQESTPLLSEQQQELRNRVRSRVRPGQKPGPEPDPEPEGSPNQNPGSKKPGESFCEWVLRGFREMLRRLQKTWQAVLAWVQEKWASFVNVVKSIWSAIKDFCSRVAKYFSSLFLV